MARSFFEGAFFLEVFRRVAMPETLLSPQNAVSCRVGNKTLDAYVADMATFMHGSSVESLPTTSDAPALADRVGGSARRFARNCVPVGIWDAEAR